MLLANRRESFRRAAPRRPLRSVPRVRSLHYFRVPTPLPRRMRARPRVADIVRFRDSRGIPGFQIGVPSLKASFCSADLTIFLFFFIFYFYFLFSISFLCFLVTFSRYNFDFLTVCVYFWELLPFSLLHLFGTLYSEVSPLRCLPQYRLLFAKGTINFLSFFSFFFVVRII